MTNIIRTPDIPANFVQATGELHLNAYLVELIQKSAGVTVQLIRYADTVGISVIVFGELLAGFAVDTIERTNRRELDAFLDSPRVHIYPVDDETTAHCAPRVRSHGARPRPRAKSLRRTLAAKSDIYKTPTVEKVSSC